jgi:mannose-1-phosphate guanylyltransferase
MNYAVVMAGGMGKRLWPLSRQSRPKQVLKLLDGGETLLSRCFERLSRIFDKDKILVLTNAAYAGLIRENLPKIAASNIIAEPVVRDTAGAIGLAAAVLTKRDKEATMTVVTADQLIEPAEVLEQAIKDAVLFIQQNPAAIITFGIKPISASSEFGYIKCGGPQKYPYCKNEICKVEEFKEKPEEKIARQYLAQGNFLWNSGMFVWKAATILEYITKYLPETEEPLRMIQDDWGTENQKQTLYEWFVKLPKISIDFAVMEGAQNVYTMRLDCRWLDLGAFSALAEFIDSDKDNNVIVAGHCQMLDCKDNIIVTEEQGHLIAAIGIENMVIAHTPDATLICRKDQTRRLKELVELIRGKTGERFL